MQRVSRITVIAALAAVGISACGSSGSGRSSTPSTNRPASAPVSTGMDVSVGRAQATRGRAPALKLARIHVVNEGRKLVLVTGRGSAVYLLTGDSRRHPLCTSAACRSAWPAVTSRSSRPRLGRGVTGRVAIWHHNHRAQITINGHPLYTYAGDSVPGIANGNGLHSFGGTWEVVNAHGAGAGDLSVRAATV